MKDELIIRDIKITSPNKILFEKQKITKKEIIEYYDKVSERMLPYLKNRIISTIRCPDGCSNGCFFKKHLGNQPGLGKILIQDSSDKLKDYYFVKNQSGIISEVQMNTIEFHIWGCTKDKLKKPNLMVFDLDPDESLDIKEIRKAVLDLKNILDKLSLVSFLKTSGGKGYHIVLPFNSSASWEKFREFSKNVALVMEQNWPDKYTTNIRLENRKNKIFIDWIRNTEGASCVAPYSIRRKNARISMPIAWDELDKIKSDEITMEQALKRIEMQDPWDNFFKVNQRID